jgi:hypothetical protein
MNEMSANIKEKKKEEEKKERNVFRLNSYIYTQ